MCFCSRLSLETLCALCFIQTANGAGGISWWSIFMFTPPKKELFRSEFRVECWTVWAMIKCHRASCRLNGSSFDYQFLNEMMIACQRELCHEKKKIYGLIYEWGNENIGMWLGVSFQSNSSVNFSLRWERARSEQ